MNHIKVGVPVSLSGEFEAQGRQSLAGVLAWADSVNTEGGVRVADRQETLPVSVVYYDDESKSTSARFATERLIVQDRVDLLLGPYSTVLTRAAAAVAERHCMVLWNHGGASENIYRRGFRWIVGILTPATEYLIGLLPMVREVDPAASRLTIVRASAGEFPRAVSTGLMRAAETQGFQVQVIDYPPAINDFSRVLDSVEESVPQVLAGVGRIHQDLLLARELVQRRHRLGSLRAMAVVAAGIQRFRDELGSAAQGFLGPSQWEPGSPPARGESINKPGMAGFAASGDPLGRVQGRLVDPYQGWYGPRTDQVLKSLRLKGHFGVDYPLAQSYAGGLVAQRCVEAAGTLDNEALRSVAGSLDFNTFYGRFKIDPPTGKQVGRSVVIAQWQEGRKVVVWPPEKREGPVTWG